MSQLKKLGLLISLLFASSIFLPSYASETLIEKQFILAASTPQKTGKLERKKVTSHTYQRLIRVPSQTISTRRASSSPTPAARVRTASPKVSEVITVTRTASPKVSEVITQGGTASPKVSEVITQGGTASPKVSEVITQTRTASPKVSEVITRGGTASPKVSEVITPRQRSEDLFRRFQHGPF